MKALERFARGCEYGDRSACHAAGLLSLGGYKDVAEDVDAGAAFLRRGCDLGGWPSCSSLGARLLMGSRRVAKDVRSAVPLLLRACDGGEIAACKNLAVLYKKGDDGVAPDEALAKRYHSRTVDLLEAETGRRKPSS